MITFQAIDSAIVRGLAAYLGVKVIEMNIAAPMPPYPFIAYDFTEASTSTDGHPSIIMTPEGIKKYVETVEFTVSIHAYGQDKAECILLGLRARDWFIGEGRQALKDTVDIVVVEVGMVSNRDVQLGDEWERRNGFNVDFRATNTIVTTGSGEWIESAHVKEM